MARLGAKAKDVVQTAKKYWNTPSKGNYIPYKEVASISAAGFGVQWTSLLASAIGLSAGNFIVGASIGLKPVDLQIMMIVANIIGMPIAIFRGYLFDNHHMKGGKFIPFMIRTSIPIAVISTVFVWFPYEKLSYNLKAAVVEVIFILMSFFLCFYLEGFQFFQQLVSPNTQERANVMSITQIIYSLAPSISNFVIPTVAGLTFGMDNIWTYRVIYPVFVIIGVVLNNIFFRKVKERLVIPKSQISSVRLTDAVREVAKNKYFWILNGANWIGFLESAYAIILPWTFVYANGGKNAPMLGLVNTIIGNASLFGMLLAPFAIKAMGKRNLLILSNVGNVILLALLYPCYKNIVLVVIIFYLNGFISTFFNIYNPIMNADMRDYQQWKTGVRIDGLFGPLGLIGTFLGFFTGFAVPAIYEHLGLKENYDVLYNDALRNNIFQAMIICSVVGAILNVIPYLFYDLTEDKQRGYIKVLKIRAMFEDFCTGDIDDDELVTGVEIINNSERYSTMTKSDIDKSALKAAKALPKNTDEEKAIRHSKIAEEREKIKAQKWDNIEIASTPILIDELNKFSTKRYQIQLQEAKSILDMPPITIYKNLKDEMKKAKALPHSNKEEKEIRADAIALVRSKATAVKFVEKYGADNIFNPTKEQEDEINQRVTNSFGENIKRQRDMKALVKNRSVYQNTTRPYHNALTLTVQSENYTHLDDIKKQYEKIKSLEAADTLTE